MGRLTFAQRQAIRPFGALIDPRPHQRNLLGGKPRPFAGRRHRLIDIRAGDALHQRTCRTVAGHNRFAVIAAVQRRGQRMQLQARFLLGRPVALEAVRGEQWLNVAGKVDGRGGRRGKFRRCGGAQRTRGEAASGKSGGDER